MMNAVQACCNQLLLVSLLTVMFIVSVDEKASPNLQQQHFFQKRFSTFREKNCPFVFGKLDVDC